MQGCGLHFRKYHGLQDWPGKGPDLGEVPDSYLYTARFFPLV
jgi:hypothetical protein